MLFRSQTNGKVTQLFEWAKIWRNIWTDGRPVPEDVAAGPYWYGYSVGKWEGDTFVIDVTAQNNKTWFDRSGNHHSDQLHVIERYTMVKPDVINYEATMEDPMVFTRPWTIRMLLERQKDVGVLDYECTAMLDEQGIHHTWPRDYDVVR